jgi:hypothetical protein
LVASSGLDASFRVNTLFTAKNGDALVTYRYCHSSIDYQGSDMTESAFTVNRTSADLATEMMALFGSEASGEAARRASHSRNSGNVVGYCAWRQAQRLIIVLGTDVPEGTVH